MSDSLTSSREKLEVAEENRQPVTKRSREIARRSDTMSATEHYQSARAFVSSSAISQPMTSHYERGERRIASACASRNRADSRRFR